MTVDHFFEVGRFTERCQKFKREMEAVVAPFKDGHNDTQKEAQQSQISSFTMFSVSSLPVHSVSFDHPDNVQPERRLHPNKHQHLIIFILR
jgi:hypothetical protein